ncbi:hypothetical protein [Motiliproteus sediminis]|uniref:hypothetical protein n=1 Tax=Motiliproteus sediminis TaxID=1468178 RepID=UPI001AEFF311|nr:hypothetical protein [Motiliproteus sediminis]
MNTEHFQKSTAYLDGLLLCLDGDKLVTITYGERQHRFHVSVDGEVSQWQDGEATRANDKAFEAYRMTFLEALLEGGSLIIRQLGVGSVELPQALGGGKLELDYLRGAAIGPKGIRGLRGEELKAVHPQGSEGGVEFHDLPSKEQIKVALLKQIEEDAA